MLRAFINDLYEELKKIYENFAFLDESGAEVPIAIYKNNLPIPEGEDSPEPFPFLMCYLESGKIEENIDGQKVVVNIEIGIYNDDKNFNGCDDVMLVISTFQQRFKRNPVFKKYKMLEGTKYPLEWFIQDNDKLFPYFYGKIICTFAVPSIQIEDCFT